MYAGPDEAQLGTPGITVHGLCCYCRTYGFLRSKNEALDNIDKSSKPVVY